MVLDEDEDEVDGLFARDAAEVPTVPYLLCYSSRCFPVPANLHFISCSQNGPISVSSEQFQPSEEISRSLLNLTFLLRKPSRADHAMNIHAHGPYMSARLWLDAEIDCINGVWVQLHDPFSLGSEWSALPRANHPAAT